MINRRTYQLVGVVVFFLILTRLDINGIIAAMKSVKVNTLIFAGVLSILVSALKSIRWNALLHIYTIECTLSSTLMMYLIGTFLGTVTPGKVGDLSRVYYLKKVYAPHISSGMLFTNVVIDRIFDIVVICVIAVSGIVFYFNEYLHYLFVVCITLTVVIAALLVFRCRLASSAVNILKKIEEIFPRLSLHSHFDEIIKGLRLLKTKRLVYPLIYNLGAYCIFYMVVFFIAYSLRMKVPFFYLVVGLSTAMILSLVPLSVAGLGIRDAILLFFFSRIGVSSEVTMSFSLLYLLICLIVPSMFGAVVYFLQPTVVRQVLAKGENS